MSLLGTVQNKKSEPAPPPSDNSNSLTSLLGNFQKTEEAPNTSLTSLINQSQQQTASFAPPPKPTPAPVIKVDGPPSESLDLPELREFTQFPTNANIIQFNPSENLQDVINNVRGPTIIDIPDGTYTVELSIVKTIYLRGSSPDRDKFTSEGHGNTITLSSPNIVLENLTIEQIDTKEGGALAINRGSVSIMNCNFTSGSISSVIISSDSIVQLDNCKILNGYNPALMVQNTAQVIMKNTEISGIQTYGVYLENDAFLISTNCTVSRCTGSAFIFHNESYALIQNASVYEDGSTAFEIDENAHVQIENSNIFNHKQNTAIMIQGPCDVIIKNSTLQNNEFGAIKVVSGASLRSINNKYINSAQNVIVVACDEGVIHSFKDSYTGSGIAAIASFSNGSFIGNEIEITDINSAGALCYEGGQLTINQATIIHAGSTAFQCRDGAQISLQNINISKIGGVGSLFAAGTSGIIENCRFIDCSIGVEINGVNEKLSFRNCEICNNSTCGLNLHGNGTKVQFIDCQINNNGQVSIEMNDNIEPEFRNCSLIGADEAILNSSNGVAAKFINCKLHNSKKIGVSLCGTKCIFEKCNIKNHGQAAINSFSGDQSTFIGCKIHKNKGFGAQVHMEGTHITFKESIFRKHPSVSLVMIDKAKATAEDTVFEDSLQPHFEVRDNSILELNRCTVGKTEKGTGIQIHGGGTLLMNESIIKDNSKLGLVVSDGGQVVLKKSSIINCGMCGIMTSGEAKLVLVESVLDSNGQFAMKLDGGNINFTNCEIKNHQVYGVMIGKDAKVDYSDNKFENNGQKDIYLA